MVYSEWRMRTNPVVSVSGNLNTGPVYPSSWTSDDGTPAETSKPFIFMDVSGFSYIWAYYGTINGKNARGWNEGLMEYWQNQFTFASSTTFGPPDIVIKNDPGLNSQNNYRIRILDDSVRIDKRRAGVDTIALTYTHSHGFSFPRNWRGVRVQFRWKTSAKTDFEIKAWAKRPAEDWLECTPSGGYVDSSDPVPDRTDNEWMIGGQDNRVIDTFRLQTIKPGQVL